jgi:hypothetical protein
MSLLWLQSFNVNGDIPLWGIIVVVVGAAGAFAALKMQLSSHEARDNERFEGVNEMLTEIRGDVKKLLREGPK